MQEAAICVFGLVWECSYYNNGNSEYITNCTLQTSVNLTEQIFTSCPANIIVTWLPVRYIPASRMESSERRCATSGPIAVHRFYPEFCHILVSTETLCSNSFIAFSMPSPLGGEPKHDDSIKR